MIPFHSLPVGCVCNFLEYKSCIIHAYQRATSINYVSLLGACVFSASSSFLLPLLLSSSHQEEAPPPSLHLAPPLLVRFWRVKGTEANSHGEKDERKRRREGKVCAAVM